MTTAYEIPAGSPDHALPARRAEQADVGSKAPKGKDYSGLPKPAAVASTAGALISAARKMLAVLDTNPPVLWTWTQVATLAGLKARGGHFNAGRKALIDCGLVRDGDLVRIERPTEEATSGGCFG